MTTRSILFRILFCTAVIFTGEPAFSQAGGDGRKMISSGFSVLHSDTARALSIFHEAALLALKEGDQKSAAEAFLHCAEASQLLDSVESTIKYFQESAKLYEKSGLYVEAALTYTRLGKYQSDYSRFDDAMISFGLSDEICSERTLDSIHAANLVAGGMVLAKIGQLTRAQQNFVDALKIYERLSDSLGIADSWNGIGVVHWKEGKNDHALEAYQKSLGIRERMKDSAGMASCNSNIGIIYRLQGKFDEGLACYDRALEIRKRLNDARGVAQVLSNKGSLLTDLGRNSEGLEFYNQSFVIKQRIGDYYGMLAYYLNVGDLYGEMGRDSEREVLYLTGLQLADSLKAMDYIKSFSRELSEFYAGTGDYKNAYAFHRKYSEVKDTLLDRDKNAVLSRLQAEYDLVEKQRSIDNLQNEQDQLLAQQQRDSAILYSLVIIIVLILIFTFTTVNRTRALRRINEELKRSKLLIEKREKEKEVLLREVHHRVKNNLQLTSSLLNLQAREMQDVNAAQALREARDRLKAISLVHTELYSGNEGGEANLAEYIADLCKSLITSNPGNVKVKTQIDIAEIRIPFDLSVTLGLIVNEIITNAVKHAFHNRSDGEIRIKGVISGRDCRLQIADDGIGIPSAVIDGAQSGFGIKLIRSLTQKLGGTLEINRNNGTEYTLQFSITK